MGRSYIEWTSSKSWAKSRFDYVEGILKVAWSLMIGSLYMRRIFHSKYSGEQHGNMECSKEETFFNGDVINASVFNRS